MEVVRWKRLHHNAVPPRKATPGSGCYDLTAVKDATVVCASVAMVPTGIAVEVPTGHVLSIWPRSGLSRQGVILVNSPGTIDSDYRGEVMVMLSYRGSGLSFDIKAGDRVAQCALLKVEDMSFSEAADLGATPRGERGFGSTGR